MKKKKNFNKKSSEAEKKSISFIIYKSGNHPVDYNIVNDSVQKLKNELSDQATFFALNDQENAEKYEEQIKQITSDNTVLPKLENKSDYYILLPGTNLSQAFNFSDFFKEDFPLPESTGAYEVLFSNQDFRSSGVIILGKKLFHYFSKISSSTTETIKEVLWHLRSAGLYPKRIVRDVKYPYAHLKKTGFNEAAKSFFQPIPSLIRWYNWNFRVPVTEYKSKSSPDFLRESSIFRTAFMIGALIVLIVLPLMSYHSSISGDEGKHHNHAEKVYSWFKTRGEDNRAIDDPKFILYYYGQSVDFIAYVFIKAFNIEKVYEARHVINGIIGALTMICVALIVRLIAGNIGAIFTLFFIFFSPRFLGHSMNNLLDAPFATGYIFTIYQTIRFLKRLPEFSVKPAILMALGIGFTISLRVGGLILVPYIFLFSGLYILIIRLPWKTFSPQFNRFAIKGLIYLFFISVAGYFLSILVWPYALLNPIKNPLESLKMFSNLTISLRVMFEGNIIWSDNLPWYYIPKNILMTVPAAIIVSFFIPLLLAGRYKKRENPYWVFVLYFATIFPVAYIIYKESNVYGGWRHMMFVYPSMVALAGIGIQWLGDLFPKKVVRPAFYLLIPLVMINPVLHVCKNRPLEYVYYNEFTGGVKKAYKKYETDYFLMSIKPAADFLKNEVLPERMKTDTGKIIITTTAYDILQYYFRNYDNVKVTYTRYYDRGIKDWDYSVFPNIYINPYQIRHNIYPPKNTIKEIEVDGVTVCAVIERKNKDDFEGNKLFEKAISTKNNQMLVQSIQLMESAIKHDKHNDIMYLNLARAYIFLNQFETARKRLQVLLSFYPDYEKAYDLYGYSYLSEAQRTGSKDLLDKSISYFRKAVSINKKFSTSYYNMGIAFLMKGNDQYALQSLNQCIMNNPGNKQAYYLMADIYKRNNQPEKAQQIMNYANSI